jgi:superfamily I DNA/RNA helicase/Zn-dependent peptidase ImmA (M78 family)
MSKESLNDMQSQATRTLIDRLCAEIEVAWERDQDPTVVDELAREHPEHASALYEFLTELVSLEFDYDTAPEEDAQFALRTKKWLEGEGYAVALRAAREACPDTSFATSSTRENEGAQILTTGVKEEKGASKNNVVPIVSFIRLVQDHTHQPLTVIAKGMDVPIEIVMFAQQNQAHKYDPVRREIVNRAVNTYGIEFEQGYRAYKRPSQWAAHTGTSTLNQLTFEQVVAKTKISKAKKRYWLSLVGMDEDVKGFTPIDRAKRRARALRNQIGADPSGLIERLEDYFNKRGINLCSVPAHAIDNHRARIVPADGCLYYNEKLDAKPAEKLFVLAHELGHLELHNKRLSDPFAQLDPLRGSSYADAGASAIARYHSRFYEEAEAEAFAIEFLAASDALYDEWARNESATSETIAVRLGIPQDVVRVQLAEGLYTHVHSTSKITGISLTQGDKGFIEYHAQTEAARHTETPALINAGPGTGKTSTLVKRVEYLLAELNAAPEEMLILTFSNEAAAELRARIGSRFDEETASSIEIYTFHGFGYSFLLTHGLDVHPDTVIIDEAAQVELLTRLLGKVACDTIIKLRTPEKTAEEIARHINLLKERLITPEDLDASITEWVASAPEARAEQRRAREVLNVYREYEKSLPSIPAVDFADLIVKPLRLLKKDSTGEQVSELVRRVREKYKWVMVDEYQDVSRAVAQLLALICGPTNPPWVVGDFRQAIYRFLGASPENVLRFAEDFKGAVSFELDTNFRSCEEIVQAANQLATLMEHPEQETADYHRRWRRGTATDCFGEHPITLATADSDGAEYAGIASHLRGWVERRVPLQDIAVLARRNIDVRNLALALGRAGIRATTSGLLTPDGAAGDLASVLAFVDQPKSTLGRVVYALGRKRYKQNTLNRIVEQLSEELGLQEAQIKKHKGRAGDLDGSAELLREVASLRDGLNEEKYSGDAFTLLAAFLFDYSNYLRRALIEHDDVQRGLVLSEIVTVFTRAATYRFSHPHTQPKPARIGFCERLRHELASSTPNRTPPRTAVDAVRVMTCHAAKGLEFPYVAVAGQTLSPKEQKWWLPPALCPTLAEDRAQADALLFVAVTRAQRAVLISHAESKSGAKKTREATSLLNRWQTCFNLSSITWGDITAAPPTVVINSIWGGAPRQGRLPARALSKKSCSIRTYLEDFVGVRFPSNIPPLYPRFYAAARAAMGRVVMRAQETGYTVSASEAVMAFTDVFAGEEIADHPHFLFYQRTGAEFTVRFASVYRPEPRAIEFLDLIDVTREVAGDVAKKGLLPLRLDLVAHFHGDDGQDHAILFRPEALGTRKQGELPEELPWSKITDPARTMAFLLLRRRSEKLQPWVFSAADGVLYKYRWNQRAETMDDDTAAALARLRDFSRRRFEWQISDYMCEQCPCRIVCPYWIGALKNKTR